MAIYKISKTSTLHEINFEADDDKELMQFYYGGVVDAVLNCKKDHLHYKITDEDGNVVYEHTYT